jgi:hypothetical protein
MPVKKLAKSEVADYPMEIASGLKYRDGLTHSCSDGHVAQASACGSWFFLDSCTHCPHRLEACATWGLHVMALGRKVPWVVLDQKFQGKQARASVKS